VISLRDALGRSVVARDSAETLGQLHGAVVDATGRRVAAIQVGKGRKARLADWDKITGVGPDALVVGTEADLRDAADAREQGVIKGDVPLLGGRVLTDRGDELGALDDVQVDEATGALGDLLAGGTAVAADRLLSVGSYAIVVRH